MNQQVIGKGEAHAEIEEQKFSIEDLGTSEGVYVPITFRLLPGQYHKRN